MLNSYKKFQIDPATAPIVKLIFEMYANGKSIVEITEHLNSMGYKTIYNKPYGKNSIRNILSNKRYIGTYTYKDTEIPNGIPRIVSDELFNKVQVVLKKNKKAPARARAREEYLGSTEKLEITRKQEKNKVYKRFLCIYNTPKYGISVKNHTFWGR